MATLQYYGNTQQSPRWGTQQYPQSPQSFYGQQTGYADQQNYYDGNVYSNRQTGWTPLNNNLNLPCATASGNCNAPCKEPPKTSFPSSINGFFDNTGRYHQVTAASPKY